MTVNPSTTPTTGTFVVAVVRSSDQFLGGLPPEAPERGLASRPRLHLTGTRRSRGSRARAGRCSRMRTVVWDTGVRIVQYGI